MSNKPLDERLDAMVLRQQTIQIEETKVSTKPQGPSQSEIEKEGKRLRQMVEDLQVPDLTFNPPKSRSFAKVKKYDDLIDALHERVPQIKIASASYVIPETFTIPKGVEVFVESGQFFFYENAGINVQGTLFGGDESATFEALNDKWRNIRIEGGDVMFKNTIFQHGDSDFQQGSKGGMFYVDNGTLLLGKKASILNCHAGEEGGAIYLKSGLVRNMGVIMLNKSIHGAGVAIHNGRFENTGNISGNEAVIGGGVYIKGGEFLNEGEVERNHGILSGGGAYISGGEVYDPNNGISRNSPDNFKYNI